MKRILIFALLLIIVTGCQTVSQPIPTASPSLAVPISSAEEATPSPTTDKTPTALTLLPESTTKEPPPEQNTSEEEMQNDQMPIFLELTFTTILNQSSNQSPEFPVGPQIYTFDPNRNILAMNPAIEVIPNTAVIIGVIDVVKTPTQSFEKKGVIQYPSSQPLMLEIVEVDDETGNITIQYQSETFSLAPLESLTFKNTVDDSSTTVVTTINNLGWLTEIQTLSSDSSWR